MTVRSSAIDRALGTLRAGGLALTTARDWRGFLAGVRAGLRLLSPAEARRAGWLSVAMLGASGLEIVAVAAVLPFINVVIQPDTVNTNRVLRRLYGLSGAGRGSRSEEHTSELQSRRDLVCRLLLEKKKT